MDIISKYKDKSTSNKKNYFLKSFFLTSGISHMNNKTEVSDQSVCSFLGFYHKCLLYSAL